MLQLTAQEIADILEPVMRFRLHLIPVLTDNYVYVLRDDDCQKTLVVDPGEAEPVARFLKRQNWQLHTILLTHHHADHTAGSQELRSLSGCEIWGASLDQHRLPPLQRALHEYEHINWTPAIHLHVLPVPGHTLGHIAFHLPECQILFCGDTLFSSGCGRLFEGTAQQMWSSLKILRALPPSTRICCAHEYSQRNLEFVQKFFPNDPGLQARARQIRERCVQNAPSVPTTLDQELKINPFLRADDPAVAQAVGLAQNLLPEQVFAHLRHLRDHF